MRKQTFHKTKRTITLLLLISMVVAFTTTSVSAGWASGGDSGPSGFVENGKAQSENGCFAKSTAEQAKSEKISCKESMKAPSSESRKAQPYSLYVAQCVFIHASGAQECSGEGISPAAARSAAEDDCVSKYGTVTGYGGCQITP
jgi:hypothetical protein